MEDVGLTLDNKLSAILVDSELDFFSFFAVRHIFDMNEYYQEATDDDLRAFQSSEKIAVEDLGNFIGVSDQWIRRKVVLITQSGVLDRLDVDVAKGLASSFGITIQVKIDGTKKMIELPADKKELKQVLNFLAENYFISLLTNTPSLSNSSRAI